MNKKIFIATRHAIFNQGSILQAIASLEYFKEKGYDPYIINYVPENERFPKIIFTELHQNSKWNSNFFKRIIFVIIKFMTKFVSNVKFKNYNQKYLKLTKKFNSFEDLKKENFHSAILCSGSDQLWGPLIDGKLHPFYFLSFSNAKKIAFSSSIGRNFHFSNEYIELLKKYEFISLRDSNYVKIFVDKGLNNTFSIFDPTMMISPQYWLNFANIRVDFKKDYLLFYRLHPNKKLERQVAIFCKNNNLKLIRISNSFEHIFLNGKNFSNISPQHFLSLIKNAKYIVSDSFHCTVFSIIFKKKFITITPGETSIRIIDLLDNLCLLDRYQSELNNMSLERVSLEIDYKDIDTKIKKLRERYDKQFISYLENL